MFPDTASKSSRRQPDNADKMLELANVMSQSTSKKFTYGLAYKLNEYTADGTIFDYVAGKKKVSEISSKNIYFAMVKTMPIL